MADRTDAVGDGVIVPLHTTNNHTLQFFLTEDPLGVCWVGPDKEKETDTHYRLKCTCVDWSEEATCTHAAYVAAKILVHPNHYYPVRVLGGLVGTGINEAATSADGMRHWLIHYAEIPID